MDFVAHMHAFLLAVRHHNHAAVPVNLSPRFATWLSCIHLDYHNHCTCRLPNTSWEMWMADLSMGNSWQLYSGNALLPAQHLFEDAKHGRHDAYSRLTFLAMS